MLKALAHRQRMLVWLLRAYFRKRKKTIIGFFIAGIGIALVGIALLPVIAPRIQFPTSKKIGLVGSYTVETLPLDIQSKLSMGLTKISSNGQAVPAAAASIDRSPDGKTYTFVLRTDLVWQDGKQFTAYDINYNFIDVQTKIVNDNTITFLLKDPYAPFPNVVSKPLFRSGLVGLTEVGGDPNFAAYKLIDIKKNGQYFTQITLEGVSRKTKDTRLIYKFYPNEDIAKTAFTLGEIQELTDIIDPGVYSRWKNVRVTEKQSTDQLVTIFFNTSFPIFTNDNKALRQALTYAIPRDFGDNTPASSPLSPMSWAYAPQTKYSYNVELAKQLIDKDASGSGELSVTLTTTPRFKNLANKIRYAWENVGVHTNVEVVQTISHDPQALLERFRIPDDPDQYVLWHSTQSTNISHYSNPKIDKLLEDGRVTSNQEERLQIYTNFQKHLVEDAPAAFLYYPTTYTLSRI